MINHTPTLTTKDPVEQELLASEAYTGLYHLTPDRGYVEITSTSRERYTVKFAYADGIVAQFRANTMQQFRTLPTLDDAEGQGRR